MTDYADTTRVIEGISAIDVHRPAEGYPHVTQEQGEEIARLFCGDFGLFRQLDEKPGLFYGYGNPDAWHWKLRQARNSCELFFEIIASDRDERQRNS